MPLTPHHLPSASDTLGGEIPRGLNGAVDLGARATRPGEPVPNEFRVSLVGDKENRPKVMLAFGHIQWLFAPHLAEDLGSVLIDAAHQAQAMARTPVLGVEAGRPPIAEPAEHDQASPVATTPQPGVTP